MADTQKTIDQRYRQKWKGRGYAKICVKFPVAFKSKLDDFVKQQSKKWEEVRK